MMLKKIVAISLGTTLVLMTLLLMIGLLVPTSTLEKLSKINSNNTQIVALDANGKAIEGATVRQNADGSTVVVDQSGKTITGATTSAATTSSTTSAVAGATAAKTPTTATTPTPTPTPAPTPAPAPAPTPAPAPVYCGGKTPCYGRADLAAHASAGNCWSYISNVVYNMTGFNGAHSDGRKAEILAGCGGAVNWGGVPSNGQHTAAKSNSQAALLNFMVGYYDGAKP